MAHPAPPSPTFWHRRRVFVTGCTGFLGPWLVRELLARGAEVAGLVRDRVRDSDFVRDRLFERVAVVRGRVEDTGRLRTAFAVRDIQTVFHLATPAVALAPNTDPAHLHTASAWAVSVLEAARSASPTTQVVIPVEVVDETGRSEAAASFARQAGSAVGVAALPHLFGGGDRTWSRFAPRAVRGLLAGRPTVRPDDDEAARSYLYVRDAARACLTLAEALAADPAAWSGRPVPFEANPAITGRDLADVLARSVAGSPAEPTRLFARPAEHPLGWERTTPLPDAAAETVGWYRRFLAPHGPAAPRRSGSCVRPAA